MPALEKVFLIVAVLFAIAGAALDVHSRRIPNWLTYAGMGSALVFRYLLSGLTGAISGVLGAAVAGAFLYVFFLLGGMGGGDVKLIAAVGAWAGHTRILVIVIAAALAGGFIAVTYLTVVKRTGRVFRNILTLLRHHCVTGFNAHPEINVNEPTSIRVPFGLAIAIGTLYGAGSALWWR